MWVLCPEWGAGVKGFSTGWGDGKYGGWKSGDEWEGYWVRVVLQRTDKLRILGS